VCVCGREGEGEKVCVKCVSENERVREREEREGEREGRERGRA